MAEGHGWLGQVPLTTAWNPSCHPGKSAVSHFVLLETCNSGPVRNRTNQLVGPGEGKTGKTYEKMMCFSCLIAL